MNRKSIVTVVLSSILALGSVAPAAFADDWGRYAGAYAALDGPGTINDVVSTPRRVLDCRDQVPRRTATISRMLAAQHPATTSSAQDRT